MRGAGAHDDGLPGKKHVLHALDGDLPAALEAEDEGVSGGGVAGHALVGVNGEERDLAAGLLGQGEAGDLALLDAQLVGQGEGGGVGKVLDELGHG